MILTMDTYLNDVGIGMNDLLCWINEELCTDYRCLRDLSIVKESAVQIGKFVRDDADILVGFEWDSSIGGELPDHVVREIARWYGRKSFIQSEMTTIGFRDPVLNKVCLEHRLRGVNADYFELDEADYEYLLARNFIPFIPSVFDVLGVMVHVKGTTHFRVSPDALGYAKMLSVGLSSDVSCLINCDSLVVEGLSKPVPYNPNEVALYGRYDGDYKVIAKCFEPGVVSGSVYLPLDTFIPYSRLSVSAKLIPMKCFC